jgi:hypothetical protein
MKKKKKRMNENKYPLAALSEKALREVWSGEEDGVWESYL